MARFALDPPDDDAHLRRVPCATRGCDAWVDVPEREVFCYDCRCAQLLQSPVPDRAVEEPTR